MCGKCLAEWVCILKHIKRINVVDTSSQLAWCCLCTKLQKRKEKRRRKSRDASGYYRQLYFAPRLRFLKPKVWRNHHWYPLTCCPKTRSLSQTNKVWEQPLALPGSAEYPLRLLLWILALLPFPPVWRPARGCHYISERGQYSSPFSMRRDWDSAAAVLLFLILVPLLSLLLILLLWVLSMNRRLDRGQEDLAQW